MTTCRPLPEEAAQPELRKLIIGQIDGAIATIEARNLKAPQKVHEVRRCLKRIRALLRLTRMTHPKFYSEQNRWFRNLGRRLSQSRDYTVCVELLHKIEKRVTELLGTKTLKSLKEETGNLHESILSSEPLERELAREAVLLRERKALLKKDWPNTRYTARTIEAGVQDELKRVKKRSKRLRVGKSAEKFHEFRKSVKAVEHQLSLLEHSFSPHSTPASGEIGKLAKTLGKHHDLTVFSELVVAELKEKKQRKRVVSFVKSEQRALEEIILTRLKRLLK